MAITNRIAAQMLVLGASTSVTWTPAVEPLVVELVVTQVVASQVRLVLYNALGQVIGSTVINGTNRQKLMLESFDGAISAQVVCLRGSAQIRLDDITGADAFGGQVQTADLATGILSADAAGRAKMAALFFDNATATAKIDVGAIPANRVIGTLPSLGTVIADPGNGNDLPLNASGTVALTSGGAETRHLHTPPSAVGNMLCVCADVIAGNIVLTVNDPHFDGTNNTVTFSAVGQTVWFQAIQVAGAPIWRLLANVGAGLSHV